MYAYVLFMTKGNYIGVNHKERETTLAFAILTSFIFDVIVFLAIT